MVSFVESGWLKKKKSPQNPISLIKLNIRWKCAEWCVTARSEKPGLENGCLIWNIVARKSKQLILLHCCRFAYCVQIHDEITSTNDTCFLSATEESERQNLHTGSSIFKLLPRRMNAGTVFSMRWEIDCNEGNNIKDTFWCTCEWKMSCAWKSSEVCHREKNQCHSGFYLNTCNARVQIGQNRDVVHKFIVYFRQVHFVTSSPRVLSISRFSLSPGPICLSEKSSCLGSILSIFLDDQTCEVLRVRTLGFKARSFLKRSPLQRFL